jgi:catechol 2,3-dioxygenase-like lactoylglutathione lyase family enzyme
VIQRIAHVNLSVDDVEAARHFYADVLGLAAAPRPADAGRAGCWFSLGSVELHVSEEQGADNARSKRHVAFEVSDIDEARGKLTAAGMGIEEGRPIAGVVRFFVRDPAGNRLELFANAPTPEGAARSSRPR